MPRESYRLRFSFWLDMNKNEEYEIADTIDDLKQERSFTRAIRQGLRLWVSLKKNDTSVLFELFPWLEEVLPDRSTDSGDGSKDDEIQALRQEVALLTEAVLNRYTGDTIDASRHPSTEPRQLPPPKPAKQYAELTISDDDIGIAKSKENPNFNMLIASAAMGMCKFEDLPPEVLAYGVEVGKVPAKYAPKAPATKPAPPKPDANPKAMDVPQFAAPVFDDDESLMELM